MPALANGLCVMFFKNSAIVSSQSTHRLTVVLGAQGILASFLFGRVQDGSGFVDEAGFVYAAYKEADSHDGDASRSLLGTCRGRSSRRHEATRLGGPLGFAGPVAADLVTMSLLWLPQKEDRFLEIPVQVGCSVLPELHFGGPSGDRRRGEATSRSGCRFAAEVRAATALRHATEARGACLRAASP